MTVVRPNSISGINSITIQSGQSLSVHQSDGTLIREIVSATGVGTFYALHVGTAATVQNNGAAAFTGIVTANSGLVVGTAATVFPNGNATFSGIVTATNFVGGGANLTGIPALTGSTNNTIVTVTGSNAIAGEANLTFDGTRLDVGGAAVSQTRTVNIGSDSEANLAIETHNDATSESSNIRLFKSGNTGASPQVVETDDNIGSIQAYGYDGTDYNNAAAKITFAVDGAPGSNDMPGKIALWTTADGATSPTERLRITATGDVGINTDSPKQQLHVHDNTTYEGIFINGNSAPRVTFARGSTATVEWGVGVDGTDGSKFAIAQAGNTAKLLLTTGGNLSATGTISDSKGDVRKSFKNEQAGTYTLVAADSGKVIGAQNTVEIPPSVFGDGDMITIVNYTAGNITLTQGSGLTLYNSGDASTGSKTLATRGMATVWFPAGTTAYMSGTGIS